jgi:3-dehydroquinate dehydratase-1
MDFEAFVLAASTTDLAEEPDARADADAVEFRLDLASNGMDALQSYDGELPLIVTNRAEFEGGQATDTPARLDALSTAIHEEAVEVIDVELATIREGDADDILEQAHSTDVSVIASVHDFDGTPPRAELESMLEAAADHGDVGKLAVTATDRSDVLDLLSVTHELTAAGETVATMAMGEAGRHSRAVAPLYGSRIGYAPVDPAEATAPGQYELSTLRTLVNQLQSGESAHGFS